MSGAEGAVSSERRAAARGPRRGLRLLPFDNARFRGQLSAVLRQVSSALSVRTRGPRRNVRSLGDNIRSLHEHQLLARLDVLALQATEINPRARDMAVTSGA